MNCTKFPYISSFKFLEYGGIINAKLYFAYVVDDFLSCIGFGVLEKLMGFR